MHLLGSLLINCHKAWAWSLWQSDGPWENKELILNQPGGYIMQNREHQAADLTVFAKLCPIIRGKFALQLSWHATVFSDVKWNEM